MVKKITIILILLLMTGCSKKIDVTESDLYNKVYELTEEETTYLNAFIEDNALYTYLTPSEVNLSHYNIDDIVSYYTVYKIEFICDDGSYVFFFNEDMNFRKSQYVYPKVTDSDSRLPSEEYTELFFSISQQVFSLSDSDLSALKEIYKDGYNRKVGTISLMPTYDMTDDESALSIINIAYTTVMHDYDE